MKDAVKSLLHRFGLYAPARAAYRAISSQHREERRLRRDFFAQLVTAGDLCFDIGANVGQTIEALRACGATVVALEPNPHCMPALRHQFGGDDQVTLVAKAVGSAPGRAELHFSGSAATASLRGDWNRQDDQTLEVEVVTLEQLMAVHGAPRLLKVDVEGFELEVFRGLGRPVPVIYFEMHAREIAVVGRILDHLRTLGRIEGVNVVSEDHSTWLWPQWCAGDEVMRRLASPPEVANVVVRMHA